MSNNGQPHVLISCGEASGDRYGAALIAALRSLHPGIRISALGGAPLAAAGAEIVCSSDNLAVMGFSEVLSALPQVLAARREVFGFLAKEKPDLVIPLDFPGFNGGLAGKAQGLGIPVYWIIAPQVWAWGGWRIPGLRKKIDRLATILPFEKKFFEDRHFDVFAMGHPLMEDYSNEYPFEEGVSGREKNFNSRQSPLTIGVVPGSRKQELEHLLPVLKVTGQAIIGHLDQRDVQFRISAAPGVDPIQLGKDFNSNAEVTQEPLSEFFAQADLALVCSGTASLEAALAGVPHEIIYRTGFFNYLIGRRLVRTENVGLSNLIMNRKMVREHIQDNAAPLPLARDILRWIGRPAERQAFYSDARRLRQMCGEPGVWNRTAEDILSFLEIPSGDSAADKA